MQVFNNVSVFSVLLVSYTTVVKNSMILYGRRCNEYMNVNQAVKNIDKKLILFCCYIFIAAFYRQHSAIASMIHLFL